MSFELDLWGRLRRATEAARADLLAVEENRRTVILTLVSAVATSYVNLLDLDRQLEISRETLRARAESLRIFDLRFKGGTISEMELQQVRSEYETAAAAVPAFEKQVAQQENNLSVLLGRNPGTDRTRRHARQARVPAVPGGPAFRAAGAAARYPPGRAAARRRQRAHRRGEGGVTIPRFR